MTKVETILKHPVTWAIGGLVSIAAVISAMFTSPFAAVATVIQVLFANASSIFTASSIAGFTLGPQFSPTVAGVFKGVALVAGTVFVWKIADGVWDEAKRRLL